MATSTITDRIVIKDKKAVKEIRSAMASYHEPYSPKCNINKEIAKGNNALKKAFTNT